MIRGLIGSICIEYRKIAIKKDTRSGRGAIKSAKRKIIARQCSMVDERRSRRWHTGRTEPINVVDAITSGAPFNLSYNEATNCNILPRFVVHRHRTAWPMLPLLRGEKHTNIFVTISRRRRPTAPASLEPAIIHHNFDHGSRHRGASITMQSHSNVV